MAAHVQHQVEANVSVHDNASGPLRVISAAAGRMNSAFSAATNLVGSFASAAGAGMAAFSMVDAIKGTSEFIKKIERMSVISKMPVARTEALVRVFEKAGVGAEEVEGIMFKLNKQADKLNFKIDSTGKAVKTGPLAMMEQMGISMKDGPDKAMVALADKVKGGRIGVERLAQTFWLSKDKAYDLHKVLVKGGDQLRKNLEEAKKHNIVNATLLAANKRLVQSQRDMKIAWEHIKQAFGAAMIPMLADLTEKVAANMDKWVDKARQFGTTLGKFLKDHHKTILTIGKLLAAQFALQKLTGGLGVTGTAKVAFGGAKALTGMLGFAAPAAAGAAPAAATAGGAAAAAGGVALGPVLLVIAAIAAVAAGIYVTWKGISENVNGIKDKLVEVWDRIAVHFAAIWDTLKKTVAPLVNWLNKVFSKQGGFGKFMLTLLPAALLGFLKVVELTLHAFRASLLWADMIGDQLQAIFGIISNLGNDLSKMIWKFWDDALAGATDIAQRISTWVQRAGQVVWEVIQSLWGGLADGAMKAYQQVVKVWKWIGESVISVFQTYLVPTMRWLGALFSSIYETAAGWAKDAVEMVEKATSWIGRAVGRVFSAIIEGLLALWRWVQNSPLGKAAGALGLGTAAAGMSGVDAVRGIVEPFVNRLATAGSDIAAAFSPLKAAKDAWKQIGLDTQRDVAVRQAARREKERTDVGDQRDKQPYNDFRGSKFDITQKFAEGFDPDRIAVAFANDLAMMGERKLQSGFSPIYAAT